MCVTSVDPDPARFEVVRGVKVFWCVKHAWICV